MQAQPAAPDLFTPLTLKDVTLKNRLVVSPMCQYSAVDGLANDWHFAHLARYALGGFGAVFVEATGVTAQGRITHGDLGLWTDAQAAPLARIAAFLKGQGCVPGIQLAHAGRKASSQRPWEGDGPLGQAEAARGEAAWPVVAPSALPFTEGWATPESLDEAGLTAIVTAFADAARRARDAGFDMVEVHNAHGYLLHEFLSPISNRRTDAWGGDREGRMRFPLRVVEAVRAVWPEDRPLFVRVSAVDWVEGGWSIEDTVAYARELKARGVDVVDCSSGGNAPVRPVFGAIPDGFQAPFAARVRAEAEIATMAVGLIRTPELAQRLVAEGQADLVALGRDALANPQWPLDAEQALRGGAAGRGAWPVQAGFWLNARDRFDRRTARPEVQQPDAV